MSEIQYEKGKEVNAREMQKKEVRREGGGRCQEYAEVQGVPEFLCIR